MGNVIGIGAAPKRKEDQRFLTGRGNYVSDIKRAGMTAGVFIRSPHAHAVLRSIDKTAALAAPGVIAVLTGDDVAADGLGSLPCGWGITEVRPAETLPENPDNRSAGQNAQLLRCQRM